MDINNLKTDDRIAEILKKLKAVDQVAHQRFDKQEYNTSETDDSKKDVSISDNREVTVQALPWFSEKDLDTELMHYIRINSDGKLEYDSIPNNKSLNDIANLKLKPNYLCDINYYKSKHYVLFIKQLDSNYNNTRTVSYEHLINQIEVEDTTFINDSTTNESITQPVNYFDGYSENIRDIHNTINSEMKYYHYVVFTDDGIMDFIANQDEISYPYIDSNLNKWFEETSNYIPLKQANYIENSDINSDLNDIADIKYSIISMPYPGIITLDSLNDNSNKLTIKLKEEYSFLPLNRVLSCLKFYSTSSTKTINDFKLFISKYFDVIV